MKTRQDRYVAGGALPPLSVTLADEVRAEAKRRSGEWARRADECAARAEKMYGRYPLRGEELRQVFDDIFCTKRA
ncbi:hypothetical protein PQR34_47525 [Paraburkholderia sediminicola]|uniref:hypothetical protein n=1 Tax=Paraburkholderia sediminicola TaxID=458836 RepID=UPI0038B74EB3